MGPRSVGNSYLQVGGFGPAGVRAHPLLAHGQDEAAFDGGDDAPMRRCARKDWLAFPFHEDDIAADPHLTLLRLDR